MKNLALFLKIHETWRHQNRKFENTTKIFVFMRIDVHAIFNGCDRFAKQFFRL